MGRREAQDVLHVAPAEIGIGVEHERDDAGHDRGGGRRAAEIVRVVLPSVRIEAKVVAFAPEQVRRDDPAPSFLGTIAGRRGDQHAGAVVRIGRGEPVVARGCDRDGEARGVDAVAVRIEVVVAGGLHDHGAQPVAAGLGNLLVLVDGLAVEGARDG